MNQENEAKAQEIYSEFQMLDQNIKHIQKQLESLTQQIIEMTSTTNGLDDLKKAEVGSEVLVPISSGIFAKASLKETNELLVNVGANVVVSKDIDSTKKLIETQIDSMKKMHKDLVMNLEEMTHKAGSLEMQMQSMMQQ